MKSSTLVAYASASFINYFELLEFTLLSNKEVKPSMIKFDVAACMSHTSQF